MSDATVQAVHDAIAAHIEDANEDSPQYLTEWCLVAAAVVSDKPKSTAYWYLDSDLPVHHAVGLLKYAEGFIDEPADVDDED